MEELASFEIDRASGLKVECRSLIASSSVDWKPGKAIRTDSRVISVNTRARSASLILVLKTHELLPVVSTFDP